MFEESLLGFAFVGVAEYFSFWTRCAFVPTSEAADAAVFDGCTHLDTWEIRVIDL
jgi:hypothetical protein